MRAFVELAAVGILLLLEAERLVEKLKLRGLGKKRKTRQQNTRNIVADLPQGPDDTVPVPILDHEEDWPTSIKCRVGSLELISDRSTDLYEGNELGFATTTEGAICNGRHVSCSHVFLSAPAPSKGRPSRRPSTLPFGIEKTDYPSSAFFSSTWTCVIPQRRHTVLGYEYSSSEEDVRNAPLHDSNDKGVRRVRLGEARLVARKRQNSRARGSMRGLIRETNGPKSRPSAAWADETVKED